MYIPSKALSEKKLPPEVLRPDKMFCIHYEDFGLGDKALYVGMYGLSRIGYIPLSAITRVFKRLGVTKGFFENGKIYGTLCYLVVCWDGKQKAFRFTHEENLDALLQAIREKTDIPVGKP
jgi:hypothetical protein